MLIKAEVITYCNQWPITENLGIRCEHHLQTSAEIQVFIARSTNECMSPNGVTIVSESPPHDSRSSLSKDFCLYTHEHRHERFLLYQQKHYCLLD